MDKLLTNKVEKLINITKAKYLSSKMIYSGNFIALIEEKYLLPNSIIMKREKIIKNKNDSLIETIVFIINLILFTFLIS